MKAVGQNVGGKNKNKQAIKGKQSWKNEETKIWIIHSYLMYEEDQYTVAYVGLVVSCTLPLILPHLFPVPSPTEFFKPLISPILSLHTQRAVSLGGRRLRGRDDPELHFYMMHVFPFGSVTDLRVSISPHIRSSTYICKIYLSHYFPQTEAIFLSRSLCSLRWCF